jgi:hypothetical protein
MNKKADNQELVLQKVQENWGTLKGLVNRIENPEAREGAIHLCDDLHDRFAVAPASTRTDYVGCFVGGLVWHSLNVLRVMKALRTSLDIEKTVSADSMIILGLFHDIGKLGNEKEDYYLPQSSDWHREKLGMHYEVNEGIKFILLILINLATRIKILSLSIAGKREKTLVFVARSYITQNLGYIRLLTFILILKLRSKGF